MKLEEQKNTQEEIKIPEAQQETPAVKPEELSEQMTKQSQKEVADFQADGEKGIGDIEKTLEDGLIIDESDKTELKGLNQKADVAENELVAEISNGNESKEKISTQEQLEAFERGKEKVFS